MVNSVKNLVIGFSPVFQADNTFWAISSEAIVPSQTLARSCSFFHMWGTHNFSPATTLHILHCWLKCQGHILRSKCCFKAARKWLICIHLSLTPLFSVTPDKPLTFFGWLVYGHFNHLVHEYHDKFLPRKRSCESTSSWLLISLRCILFNI